MCIGDGAIFRADVFSLIVCGCGVSMVKIPVPLANLYRLQPIATDSKKTMYSRTPLIRPPSESHWCGRIRGMVVREGLDY